MTSKGATGKPISVLVSSKGKCLEKKCIKNAGHPGACWPQPAELR